MPFNLDEEPTYLHERRIEQFTYSPMRRGLQRLWGTILAVISAALGLDISYWQTTADAQAAKAAGLKYIFIRALYGLSVDTRFGQHWAAFAGVMPRSAYLYYRDTQDPLLQAKKLFETCMANGGPGELPPTLDVESINNPTLTASKIKQCAEELARLFDKKPLIYTAFYVWRDQVIGNKDWAIVYELFIAGYPLVGWEDDYPEKVLNYPPMIPAPWKMWTGDPDEPTAGRAVAWQWTSSAPASEYGVSGNYLDLDHCSPAFAKKYLAGMPPPIPPPDPNGDPLMQFKNQKDMNIRAGPGTNYPIVGTLPANTTITALEVRPTDSNSVWVLYETGKWVAMVHDGGGPFLVFVPPVPV